MQFLKLGIPNKILLLKSGNNRASELGEHARDHFHSGILFLIGSVQPVHQSPEHVLDGRYILYSKSCVTALLKITIVTLKQGRRESAWPRELVGDHLLHQPRQMQHEGRLHVKRPALASPRNVWAPAKLMA